MDLSKTEKTRQHIIATTAPIFNRKGYAGTSITDITKATKLTSGSIYGNFANKEEVALAAFDYNLDTLRRIVQRRVDGCAATKDKLLMYIRTYHNTGEGSGCPMQNTLIEADDTNEGLRRKAAAGILLWKKDLITVIKRGIDEGVFKKDTDPERTALHIIALNEFSFLYHSAGKPNDEILDIALEVAEKIFV